jgi:hypothetical protein
MMIGSIIDGVGGAANVARRHLHRGSNTRTDAIGDAVMIASGVSCEFETIPLDAVTWKYLFGRCGTKAASRHITHKL